MIKLQVIRQRRLWWSLSALAILAGVISMVISWQQLGTPLRPGIDFVGGTLLQLELDCTQPSNCEKSISVAEARTVFDAQGLGNSSIQVVVDPKTQRQSLFIRAKALELEQRQQLTAALSEKIGTFKPSATGENTTVGPAIGQEIFTSGLQALILSFAGITVYLSFRFKFDYAFFAIVALFHDVLITVGAFSILGLVFGTEIDSLFLVSLLTIVGFSVNDTVVIYDRIRETSQLNPQRHIDEIVDEAVNQTLTRSLNTTLTVLLTLLAIFLFGGETLKNFALALIIGFTMGAYSSIFIASTLLAWWRVRSGQAIVGTVTAIATPQPEDSQPST